MSIPKSFAEFKKREDARKALYWKLVGQAASAFPDDFSVLYSSCCVIGRDEGWSLERIEAEVVELAAKKWPKHAFTHA